MYDHLGAAIRSSFGAGIGKHPPVIDAGHAVITVLSGSTWPGNHSSMFVEYCTSAAPPPAQYETRLIHLTGPPPNYWPPEIEDVRIQDLTAGADNWHQGWTHVELAGKEHFRSYPVTTLVAQTVRLEAVRFHNKLTYQGGSRYTYSHAGGLKGRLKVDGRGINCADFIIKVLGDAGVANLPTKLFSTPYRVAQ
jgi:hypothetical protein